MGQNNNLLFFAGFKPLAMKSGKLKKKISNKKSCHKAHHMGQRN